MAANNMTNQWLEGVRARVTGKSRSAAPYGLNKIDISDSEILAANEWFSGWDTANIILGFHDAKEPA